MISNYHQTIQAMVGKLKASKKKTVISSSETESIFDHVVANVEQIINVELVKSSIVHKPIRFKIACQKHKTKKELLIELMSKPNLDAGKDIVVGICSNSEEIE